MNTTEFVQRRIDAFNRGDVETMVSDYTPQSIIMTPMGNMVGADQMRMMIAGFVEEFAAEKTKLEIIRTNTSDRVAHFAWKAETAKTSYKFGNETYFLDKNDKIVVHLFDGDMVPK